MGSGLAAVAALIGWRFGGIDGACWAAVGSIVALAAPAYLLDKSIEGRRREHYAETTKIAAELAAIRSATERVPKPGGMWQDLRQLLLHNANITPAYIDEQQEAILWAYQTSGQLPTCDLDVLGVLGAYLKRQ